MVRSERSQLRPRIERSELVRKAVHVGSGAFALLLAPLGFLGSLAMATTALIHNAFLLPRYAKQLLYRDSELQAGFSRAIVLYPAAVLLLILAFPDRLGFAAAAWGILAAGDGVGGFAGRLWGQRWPLPWNPSKSWVGFAVFVGAGTLAGGFLLDWNGGGPSTLADCLLWALLASGFAALAESCPGRSEDNLTVPLAAALTLVVLGWPGAEWERLLDVDLRMRWLEAVSVNLLFAGIAWRLRLVDGLGAATGFGVATSLYLGYGLPGWGLLFSFLLFGNLATRWRYRDKERLGVAEGRGGRRSWVSVLSKGSVPGGLGFLAVATDRPEPLALAVVGALATVTFDTVASELGPLYGRRAFRIWPLERTEPGSEGAISVEGTLAGLLSALVIGLVAFLVGLIPWEHLWAPAVAALVANLAESLAGSTLERNGYLAKGWINFGNALLGSGLALGFLRLLE